MPCLALVVIVLAHRTLTVGDGKMFSRVEDAVAAAWSGDRIDVYPPGTAGILARLSASSSTTANVLHKLPEAKTLSYADTAIIVRTPNLTIAGIGPQPVRLDGQGFDYSGVGSIPRAIFQIDSDGSGTKIDNFELCGAHNRSFNGAGVRINAANRVGVENCDIHGNDMGIMSNGHDGDAQVGADQVIDHCRIHENGNAKDPGYNHNLYLGGTSVTVQFCDIYSSLTGHNLKSRAHFTLVQYCHIHDSANRELDFVEAWDTERPHSNAVLIGNLIEKDPSCSGNRMTIHFGREKGVRNGTVYLINNTIVTPFQSPVLALTAPKVSTVLYNNRVVNDAQSAPVLVQSESPAQVSGEDNHLSDSYRSSVLGLKGSVFGKAEVVGSPPVADATYSDGDGKVRSGMPRYRWTGAEWAPGKGRWIGCGAMAR